LWNKIKSYDVSMSNWTVNGFDGWKWRRFMVTPLLYNLKDSSAECTVFPFLHSVIVFGHYFDFHIFWLYCVG
jgi:hypothetical protein